MAGRKNKTTSDADRYVRDLTRLLDDLRATHEELLGVIREKLDAMKRADLRVMREMTIKEQALARTIQQREGLRRQLMDAIGAALGLSGGAARAITISRLAARLSVEQADALRRTARALGSVMHEVAHSNRIAGSTCREVINHLRWVFASVRPTPDAPSGYAVNGAHVTSPATMLFETVG